MFTLEEDNDKAASDEIAGIHNEAHLDFSGPLDMQDQYTSELPPFALQQMQYDSNYVEDVNTKMRIPTKLTVAMHDGHVSNPDASYSMEVPDKIVVTVGDDGVQYGQSKNASEILFDQEIHQVRTPEPVSLVTPPRKLTLAERNLDALDVQEREEESVANTKQNSMSMLPQRDIQEHPEVQQAESAHSEDQDEISLLRRQVFKLHRRITAIENLQAERSKRDTYVYAISLALFVINGWFLYTSKRP